jgi:hypothetical protein
MVVERLHTSCVPAYGKGTKRKRKAKSGGRVEKYGRAQIYSLQQAQPKMPAAKCGSASVSTRQSSCPLPSVGHCGCREALPRYCGRAHRAGGPRRWNVGTSSTSSYRVTFSRYCTGVVPGYQQTGVSIWKGVAIHQYRVLRSWR